MTEQTETPDLLPCPFCGGKGELTNKFFGQRLTDAGERADYCYVFCHSCQACSIERTNMLAAVAAWNARTDGCAKAYAARNQAIGTATKYAEKHGRLQADNDALHKMCAVLDTALCKVQTISAHMQSKRSWDINNIASIARSAYAKHTEEQTDKEQK